MQVRIQRGFLASGLGLALLGVIGCALLIGVGVFTYYWISFGRMIDERLAGHVNQTTARIYAAPERIFCGEKLSSTALVADLQRAGYNESKNTNTLGWYQEKGKDLEIHPQHDSYFAGKNALDVTFTGPQITAIKLLDDGSSQDVAEVEPQLLTNLFDSSREKRRKVLFSDIPPVMVNALLSAEDKRFFEHHGFDMIRIMGAAWADLRRDARAQGASTLTMQVSRSFFFSTERTWKRKVAETMVSLELEHRFTKDQIFELYANEIYLGNRGSFAIHGFAEGSLAYFNKDLHDITLPEAAFLAGIIRAPNRYATSEFHPDRANEARDRVLTQMMDNRFITLAQMKDAKHTPLHLAPAGLDNSDAPYFVDMVKDHLLEHFTENDLLSQSFRVYSTIDPALEHAASEAISVGIANVDQQLARKYAKWKKAGMPAEAQVAVVVLDPHTGEIRAVVGGRDYGQSQLNRVLSHRQPGSVFKPFVYAAAFDNAVQGLTPVVTPATTVVDEPTTFDFDGKEYTPDNYGQEFHGTVTAREALTQSMNVATIKVAEMIGYGRVVDLARQMGLSQDIQPTPAVALGAYDMTPLDVAAGYTAFANGGVRAEPLFIDHVVNSAGETLEHTGIKTKQVLDPRVAYQVTSVLEDVIDHGTGATVRARGFAGPAAGKTGTSHDGWFAGYTSNLLCIVWVGFDDNRELTLTGGNSAAPIWAEFMKRATALPQYHDLQDFAVPEGVNVVDIDPQTLQLASPACPMSRKEVFISGTEPTEFCDQGGRLASSAPTSFLGRLFGGGQSGGQDRPASDSSGFSVVPAQSSSTPVRKPNKKATTTARANAPAQPAPPPEQKKGFLDRLFGVFGKSNN